MSDDRLVRLGFGRHRLPCPEAPVAGVAAHGDREFRVRAGIAAILSYRADLTWAAAEFRAAGDGYDPASIVRIETRDDVVAGVDRILTVYLGGRYLLASEGVGL